MALTVGVKLGAYEILSVLGAGGMGEVYKAHDPRLDRCVAIKVLPPHLAEDVVARERLRREAMAAAALDDPFICKIFEIGEDGGTVFIVMEYVPGETLRARLASRRLSTIEALQIADELAEALEDAHAKHFVHRDLKPANVMLTPQGHVKVMDFGLVKPMNVSADDSTLTALTDAGSAVGTLGYMSPEQLRGEPVDPRSDLFSFGIVVGEMLSGKNPFHRATRLEWASAILRDAPNLPGDLPEELAELLRRLLAKSPAERFQSIGEAHAVLTRIRARITPAQASVPDVGATLRSRSGLAHTGLAAVMMAGLIGGGLYWASTRNVAPVASLAVLPFDTDGKDSETAILADGLSDDIINSLSRLNGIKVISRMSSSRFKGNRDDPKAVGKALDVQALLVAGVARREANLLLRVELVNPADQTRIWGANYDRPISDLIEIKRDIMRGVAGKLAVSPSAQESGRLTHRPSDDPEAYRLFLMGRQFMVGTGPEMNKAVEYLQRAIALEPDYALARANLAASYLTLTEHGLESRSEFLANSRAEVNRALEIDANLAEAHSVAGRIAMLERRWDVAGAEFRKAVELSPASLDVYLDYAPYLAIMGRPDESRAALLKAKALDPLSVVAAHALAISFLVYKDYDGAIAEFKRAIALNPNWTWGSIKLGVAFTHKGMCRDALEAATIAEDALRHGDTPLARAWLGYIYGICGLKGRAQDALRQLAKWPASIREDPLKEATVYAGLRDKERVHRLLEQAGEREGGNSLMLVSFPRLFWPDLEREPAFRRIIERVGLPLKLLSPDP